MSEKWKNRLNQLLEENNTIHNTTAALREAAAEPLSGPSESEGKISRTFETLTAKTAKTTGETFTTSKTPAAKTAKTPSEGGHLGLVATWSGEFGFVSVHDPTAGEWWDLPTKDAPDWALSEARKRKELYKGGNRRAYRLTSREMEEIWAAERPPEEGIIEEHPIEEEVE